MESRACFYFLTPFHFETLTIQIIGVGLKRFVVADSNLNRIKLGNSLPLSMTERLIWSGFAPIPIGQCHLLQPDDLLVESNEY